MDIIVLCLQVELEVKKEETENGFFGFRKTIKLLDPKVLIQYRGMHFILG